MGDDVKKLPIHSDKAPSEEFERAFTHSGGCRVTCDCGREHFSEDSSWDFEDGELFELRLQAVKNSDAVISHGEYTVQRIEVGGHCFVVECPCNGAAPYENFIWANRRDIARYLELKVETMTQENLDAAGIAVRVAAATESVDKLETG